MKSFLCCVWNHESGFRVLLLLCPPSSLSHLISSTVCCIAPSSPHRGPHASVCIPPQLHTTSGRNSPSPSFWKNRLTPPNIIPPPKKSRG